MNALTAVNALQATPNTVALATTVLFADASVTSPVSVQTNDAPFVTTQDILSLISPSQKTPARGLSLTRGIQRDCEFGLEVQLFKGGIVTIRDPNLIFSI